MAERSPWGERATEDHDIPRAKRHSRDYKPRSRGVCNVLVSDGAVDMASLRWQGGATLRQHVPMALAMRRCQLPLRSRPPEPASGQ